MNKKLKLGIIIPFILFFIILMTGIILINFIFTKSISGKSKNEVVKLYRDNQKLFDKAKEELTEEYLEKDNQDISFRMTMNNLTIEKYINDMHTNMVDIVELSEEDCDKYLNTIKIIKELKIKSISTYNKAITFTVLSNLGYGKDIAYISQHSDINQYKEDNYVIHMEKIEGNWYYIEAE